MSTKMTDRQRRFCEEYLVDLNATQAAIRAGYSTVGAGQQGCELLKIPKIRARIDADMAELSRRTGVNAERVIRELAKIALVNPRAVIDFNSARVLEGASDDDTAAITGVKVKTMTSESGASIEREVRMESKVKALELLGKHFGMFTDNIHLTGEMGVQIIDDIPDDDGADTSGAG
jgi:phage terminase small subunit